MKDPIIAEDIKRIIDSLAGEFQSLAGKTILVTGTNGFLPSYFVDTVCGLNETILAESPAKIIAVTRRAPEKNDRLVHHIGNPNVIFSNQDVSKDFKIPVGVDYIIHGASKASPGEYMNDPIGTIDANINGIRILLDYARENKVKGLLFISSGEIYGNPDPKFVPIKETYLGNADAMGPRSSYQESKRFAETLCYNFWKIYGVPVKIARCFHTYGPKMLLSDGRVIPDFMRKCFAGENLTVVKDSGILRTFAYVSDTIEAFWRILLMGRSGEAYNVGSSEEISIEDLGKLFVKMFNGKIKIDYAGQINVPSAIDAPKRTTPDITKIKSELKYTNKIPALESGLLRLKNWYEHHKITK